MKKLKYQKLFSQWDFEHETILSGWNDILYASIKNTFCHKSSIYCGNACLMFGKYCSNYCYIVTVDSNNVLVFDETTCLSCRHELCRGLINFPNMQTGLRHIVFFLDVNAVPGHRREKGSMGSGPCFPIISHNIEKRLRIRTLFHVRAFKLIMDERISFPSLFSTPRRFQREKRKRESEKSWRGNT